MRIVDPQSAVLTNIEVLAYLTANPPRRPPNPPPNSRHWVPSPDLRDHNTVVKEIHNYVTRLSPHVLSYPAYVHPQILQQQQAQQQAAAAAAASADPDTNPPSLPLGPAQSNAPTPLDHALRELITRLKPFGLTKGEVLMIVNLGVGLSPPAGEGEEGEAEAEAEGEGEGEGEEGSGEQQQQQVNGNGTAETNGEADGMEVDGEGGAGEEEGGEGGLAEEDYGAMALLDTVIEEREERLSEDDVASILGIIREVLGSGQQSAQAQG